MKLHEYQSKKIFSEHGISIPVGRVAVSAEEAKVIAGELNDRVVIKSQVLVGGRGKAGGIRLAKKPEEAYEIASQILTMSLKGLPVRKVLVEQAAEIEEEIYLGITNDRDKRKPVIISSSAGGVDIEDVARFSPEKIIRTHIDPLLGLKDYQARDIAAGIDLPRELWKPFVQTASRLWDIFSQTDSTLVEINPLVITKSNQLLAVDGKMIIDDNALFRHPDLEEKRDLDVDAASEVEARKYGLAYIKLEGEIGCLVNGAGLAMTTMDIIKHFGGSPANFLDIGGGAGEDKVAAAFRIILADPKVITILVNIFGGITRGDEVARGILAALKGIQTEIPIIIRLVGTNAEEGLRILSEAKMITADTLEEAAQQAVQISKVIK